MNVLGRFEHIPFPCHSRTMHAWKDEKQHVLCFMRRTRASFSVRLFALSMLASQQKASVESNSLFPLSWSSAALLYLSALFPPNSRKTRLIIAWIATETPAPERLAFRGWVTLRTGTNQDRTRTPFLRVFLERDLATNGNCFKRFLFHY